MYDFGSPNLNLEAYGSTVPPDYEPRRLRIPTAVYWAATDWLADRLDVEVRACCLLHVYSTLFTSELYSCAALRCTSIARLSQWLLSELAHATLPPRDAKSQTRAEPALQYAKHVEGYAHADFIWAHNAARLIYSEIVQLFRKYL